MGEISDAIMAGVLCQGCGVFVGKEVGYPRYCGTCEKGGSMTDREEELEVEPTPGLVDEPDELDEDDEDNDDLDEDEFDEANREAEEDDEDDDIEDESEDDDDEYIGDPEDEDE